MVCENGSEDWVWRPPEPSCQQPSAESSCTANMHGCLAWFWALGKNVSIPENIKVGKWQPREFSSHTHSCKELSRSSLGRSKRVSEGRQLPVLNAPREGAWSLRRSYVTPLFQKTKHGLVKMVYRSSHVIKTNDKHFEMPACTTPEQTFC